MDFVRLENRSTECGFKPADYFVYYVLKCLMPERRNGDSVAKVSQERIAKLGRMHKATVSKSINKIIENELILIQNFREWKAGMPFLYISKKLKGSGWFKFPANIKVLHGLGLTVYEIALLIVLSRHADYSGKFFLKISTMAKESGVSKRTAKRVLHALIDGRIIIPVKNVRFKYFFSLKWKETVKIEFSTKHVDSSVTFENRTPIMSSEPVLECMIKKTRKIPIKWFPRDPIVVPQGPLTKTKLMLTELFRSTEFLIIMTWEGRVLKGEFLRKRIKILHWPLQVARNRRSQNLFLRMKSLNRTFFISKKKWKKGK